MTPPRQPRGGPSLTGRIALWGCAAFSVVEGTIRFFDLYRTNPWVDVPSHFASGIAVSALVLWLLERRAAARIASPVRTPVATVFLANLAVAALWEMVEVIDEVIDPDPPHLRDYFFWDGFWDIVSAAAGALALFAALTLSSRRSPGSGSSTTVP